MEKLYKSVVPTIESVYDSLTNSEKTIADFFIQNNKEDIDLSASNVAELLHVSEASLTRFAKKCGFSGYREFIYAYSLNIATPPDTHTEITKNVLSDYEEILSKTFSLIDETQIERVIDYILSAKRVYFYGIGSSGLVAQEMKFRFMRLGLICDAFTESDMMRMNSSLLDEDSVVIALSISSSTPAVLNALEIAHTKNAKTILLTAKHKAELNAYCDEIVTIATRENLNYGNRISPQFPLLVLIDIIYAYFSRSDIKSRKEMFTSTLSAIDEETEKDGDQE